MSCVSIRASRFVMSGARPLTATGTNIDCRLFQRLCVPGRFDPKYPNQSFSSRTECEEKHHLGRALSRSSVSPQEQKQWEAMTKKWPREWNDAPFENYLLPSAKYEMDALDDIHRRSFQANVLLEIRDVRLPASSHHPSFTRLAKHRFHLICYTHADMIDAKTRDRVEKWTNESWPKARCMFVDTRQERGDPEAFNVVYDGLLHHIETKGGINTALTVGVANTGKSSLLLCLLRNAKVRDLIPKKKVKVTTGKKRHLKPGKSPEIKDVPGKTREITEFMIRQKPRAYFLDVPGITNPSFFFEERPEAWYGFGAANLLPQSKIMNADVELQTAFSDYLLFCLNRDKNFAYVKKIGLEKPTDDIHEVLERLGNKYKNLPEDQLTLRRCALFLKLFNTGNFGPVILDDISKRFEPFQFRDSHFQRKKFLKKKIRGDDDDHYDDDDDDDYDDDDDDFVGYDSEHE
mmetsp:Transcript_1060/g.1989  ORF Transcript_1060/g.1989 Transcript_1060/m.1989 type:complete len:461 (-) Transcript_1060:108-1490(-)